jgi:L-ascorbate metabolism protein UlaG (beta-lactamase superfamily)
LNATDLVFFQEVKSLVEIIWHGHACFELRGKKAAVVFDPFAGIGLPEPKAEADIVLCSHSHRDHNNAQPVLKKGGTLLEGFVGSMEIQGVPVKGVATFHDAAGGSQRGRNSIYNVQLDGMAFCHLGDLGHDLTTEQVRGIGEVDVLFIPVGGGPTIGLVEAPAIVERLKPKIIVPMHYNIGVDGMPEFFTKLNRVEDYLKGKKNVERIEGRSFTVTKDKLPKEQKIVALTFIA